MSRSQLSFNALIPARAGSKSIPNKNLVKLGSSSLIDRSIDLAKSWRFKSIFISTDIETIMKEEFGDNRIKLRQRPDELATDKASMEAVVTDAIDHFKIKQGEWIILMQPTSPFRTKADLDNIAHLIDTHHSKSLISVTDVGGYHPERMYTKKSNKLKPLRYTSFNNRQELMKIYIRNGCFYAFRVGDFMKDKSFYIHPCLTYEMSKEASINIDHEMDLLLAKQLL